MANIPNVDKVVEILEKNPPTVYTKCNLEKKNKNGTVSYKRHILNLTTGDVFKNRKLNPEEKFNFCLMRKYERNNSIEHYAYQNAQIVDGNIILTTWVFADYYNYPKTTKLPWSWWDAMILPTEKKRNIVDPSAILNILLSKPKIAAMVMVTPEKEVLSWNNNDYVLLGTRHTTSMFSYLSENLADGLYSASHTRRVYGLSEAFKELFKVGYAGANNYLTFDEYKDVAVFMRSPAMIKKSNENQTKVEELATITTAEHDHSGKSINVICNADRVNDEWAVLRWYKRVNLGEYIETSRMYVSKTEAIHCRSDLNGGWIYASAKIKATTFNADEIILQSEDVFDNTKLEYFKSVSNEMPNRSAALYMLTMYPEFEKMCKSGLGWLCYEYINSTYQQSWKNYLNDNVRHVDWKAKSILKMIGINRHQIEKISEFRERMKDHCPSGTWSGRYLNSIISKMKVVFNVNSLSSIDNNTFDYIIDSISDIDRFTGSYLPALSTTFALYHNDAMYFIKDLNSVLENDKDNIIDFSTQYGYHAQARTDRVYLDVLRMIETGNYFDVIRPRFSSVDELLGHHNIMVDLINADRRAHEARLQRQYQNAFTDNQDKWKKWEWNDDRFCIVVPKAPVDIAIEGITLRHCVKSYIPHVANGSTNIVFIRRNGDENSPFFTVEVDQRNNIRQVHGMCNCNVDSVEGLTEFVKNWCKAKKLKYNQNYANGCRVAR